MSLLRERLKRASKNRVVPDIATIQSTTITIIPSVHRAEDIVHHDEYSSDCDDDNLLNVVPESDYVQSTHNNCSNELPTEHENNTSCKTEDILLDHSSLIDLDAGFR